MARSRGVIYLLCCCHPSNPANHRDSLNSLAWLPSDWYLRGPVGSWTGMAPKTPQIPGMIARENSRYGQVVRKLRPRRFLRDLHTLTTPRTHSTHNPPSHLPLFLLLACRHDSGTQRERSKLQSSRVDRIMLHKKRTRVRRGTRGEKREKQVRNALPLPTRGLLPEKHPF